MYYENFIEETCDGTGATMALQGAISGRAPFSAKFADGEYVGYTIEDSGSDKMVGGIGLYVSATDDITRNDLWNYNGSVFADNPGSNITLTGSTGHKIRCAGLASFQFAGSLLPSASLQDSAHYRVPDNIYKHDSTDTLSNANREWFCDAVFFAPTIITTREVEITTADGTTTHFRVGIYECNPITGKPGKLLDDSGDLSASVGSTGNITHTLSSPLFLPAGRYFFSVVSDSTNVAFRCPNFADHLMPAAGFDRGNNNRKNYFYANSVTGALASNPTISGAIYTFGSVPMGFT